MIAGHEARTAAAGRAAIARAAKGLRAGRLVAFPTDTVYGLGADATSDATVESSALLGVSERLELLGRRGVHRSRGCGRCPPPGFIRSY
jgi:Telomere recombination